jgi:cation-dependent mannose-6-phosphate receptor
MHLPTSLYILLLSVLPGSLAASDSKPAPKPCTIHSPSTGAFIDLRPLELNVEGTKSQSAANESYHVKGYDYPSNFSINFCGPVVEELKEVEGIPKNKWANISAFYKDSEGDIYSLGQGNDELLFRGKRLLMNLTMGSPCPELDEDGKPIERREIKHGGDGDDDDDDDDDDNDDEDDEKDEPTRKPKKASSRRKSTMISFICDTSPLLSTKPSVSFVGTMDHCSYWFEVRSRHVCGGTTTSDTKGTLGPAGVFGVILGIALLVYLIGGVVYQRNVMHQRGWRQLPNYAVWAGLFGFISVCIPRFSCALDAYHHLPSIPSDAISIQINPLLIHYAAGHVHHPLLVLSSERSFPAKTFRRPQRRLPPRWKRRSQCSRKRS